MRATEPMTTRLRLTPFHPLAIGFLAVGLVFGLYNGLTQIGLVPRAAWISSRRSSS